MKSRTIKMKIMSGNLVFDKSTSYTNIFAGDSQLLSLVFFFNFS